MSVFFQRIKPRFRLMYEKRGFFVGEGGLRKVGVVETNAAVHAYRNSLFTKRGEEIMKTAAGLLVVIIALSYPLLCPAASQTKHDHSANSTTVEAKSKETLEAEKLGHETEKLKQEVIKLRLENENIKDPFSSNGALITAFIAFFGILVTIWKQLVDSSRQRNLDREQRETEGQRRIDEKFTSIVTDLGSKSEAIRAGAAVSIVTFIKPEYKQLHDQVYAILHANLKIKHSDVVNNLIVAAFEKSLRWRLDRAKQLNEKFELDISRANLCHGDLSGLDLSNSDLGFAQLKLANMRSTILFRARGYQANLEKARLSKANLNEARLQKAQMNEAYLHECNLIAADLKEADLRGAQFQQAKMQSAHLEGADITGAKFEQADINDTYFIGVKADSKALRSLVKASNWQKAHFDEEVRLKLEEMARS